MAGKKKSGIRLLLLLLVIAAAALFGAFQYWKATPDYALYTAQQDIQESGKEGLKPHLTGSAAELVDGVDQANSLLSGVLSALGLGSGQLDLVTTVMDQLESVEWELQDKLVGTSQATYVVSFRVPLEKDDAADASSETESEAGETITGSLELNLVKEHDEWLIESVSSLQFD